MTRPRRRTARATTSARSAPAEHVAWRVRTSQILSRLTAAVRAELDQHALEMKLACPLPRGCAARRAGGADCGGLLLRSKWTACAPLRPGSASSGQQAWEEVSCARRACTASTGQ